MEFPVNTTDRTSQLTQAPVTTVDRSFPKPWVGRLAYIVSMIGSPPVLGAGAIALTASILSGRPHRGEQTWLWALVCASLVIVAPLTYIVWLLRRGQVSDIDVQRREQRAKPLVVSIISTGLACIVLLVGRAPAELLVLAGALWLQTIIIFGITLRWKISMHSSAAAGTGTLIWALTGTLLPLLIMVPLIVWSRVRLKRHTFAQTVAGAALGFTVFVAALRLV